MAKIDILKDLDSSQVEAVYATDGPVLILAGAGSGKTRVLTYKVAYLISKGINPENILCVTFTNKAANEMKERVIRIVDQLDSKNVVTPFVGTFHSFCSKLLRIEGKHLGLGSNYVIYDKNDSLTLIKNIMKNLANPTRVKPSSVLGAISSAKGELVTPGDYATVARTPFGKLVLTVYEKYQKELRELNACDFDDLLSFAVRLFENVPQLLAKWARRFEYILVDEYQDVNTAQYKLTKQLASVHGNLTVVGDASQAIYSFRGADFRNILNFERDFKNARVFNLEKNYRSTQTILDAANAIIAQNSSHPVLKLWTENIAGEKISIYSAANEVDEANFIVERILESGLPFSSFAVLYRTNAQSRAIEEAFLHENIPYRLFGGVRFYERKEVKDILSYLRVINNPKDKIALARINKLGKKRLLKFEELSQKLALKRMPLPLEVIDKILEATEYLTLVDDGTEQGLMRVENVKELRSVAAEFESLGDFLENIALMEEKVTPAKSFEDESAKVVTLMTIHNAKGLEFDVVFIIGMEEGLFPHARSMLDPEQLEEERRLAYVAATRARKKLYLTYATRRLYFGITNSNLPSRFVVDIPQELILSL